MPSISAAIAANQRRMEMQTVHQGTTSPRTAVASAPGVASRTVLPTRGTYPPNIILATDFESATGLYYGRLRARTFVPTGKLLGSV